MTKEKRIDLRSDTLTQPTKAMQAAMFQAPMGDDVYGEDPSVNELQEYLAHFLGKEAVLFVPSGTMANQVAIKAHTQPGDEVVAHPNSHIVRAESGGAGVISGVQFRFAGKADGSMEVQEIEPFLQHGYDPHFAPTRLICVENTHNFAGGTVFPQKKLEALSQMAKKNNIALHMDGARMLNACVKTDLSAKKMLSFFDSGTLCFSKGLGAPLGSVVYGSHAFIQRCTRWRKMLGGGMRQLGMVAKAAHYAMENHVERLAEDHAHAQAFASILEKSPNLKLSFGMPETNLVFFESLHMPTSLLVEKLRSAGILVGSMSTSQARAVTHLDVSLQEVEQAAHTVVELAKQG